MNGLLEVQRGVPVPSLVCEVAWVGESAGHFLLVADGYFAFEEQQGSEFGIDNFCRRFLRVSLRLCCRRSEAITENFYGFYYKAGVLLK